MLYKFVLISLISFVSFSNGKTRLNEEKKIWWRKKLKKDALDNINNYEDRWTKGHILFWAGSYLAAHKYYGLDYRKIVKKPTFYRQFAVPVLEEFHPVAKSACEEGPVSCLKNVYFYAAQSTTLFPMYHTNIYVYEELNYPFESLEEMFRYRMTASYYLCWYTMRREPVLSKEWGYCFDYFRDWSGDCVYEAEGKPMTDVRGTTERPFSCEMLWFCPDPCYGRSTAGVVKSLEKDTGNPCANQPDTECHFPPEANTNFHDLIRNKFNYTCSCDKDLKGYAWDKQYEVCSDFDECASGDAICHGNKQCINTDGSYTCRCKKGMIETRRGECVCLHNMRLNAEGGCSCPHDYRITTHGTCEPIPISITTSKITIPVDIVDSPETVFNGLNSFHMDDVFVYSKTTSMNKMFRWMLFSLLIVHAL